LDLAPPGLIQFGPAKRGHALRRERPAINLPNELLRSQPLSEALTQRAEPTTNQLKLLLFASSSA